MWHGAQRGFYVGHVDSGAMDLDEDLVRSALRLEPFDLQIKPVEMIGLLLET
jgi:hypothetical protein